MLLPAPHRPVTHGYEEEVAVAIRTYSLEEIAAEKLRTTQQTRATLLERGWSRSRARDFYDLWHLVRLSSARLAWPAVRSILPAKCALRAVEINNVEDIFDPIVVEAVRTSWERSLGPFIGDLPPVDEVFAELRAALDAWMF